MARDMLSPFGRGGEGSARPAYEYQLPTFDPLLEAQGGYGPQTITRPMSGRLRQALQWDPYGDQGFRDFAHAALAQRVRASGLPHRQQSLLLQSLLGSALEDQNLQARYRREREGFDPLARRFLDEYEEERTPGLGNQRRAIDLLQQTAARGRREPALGEGLQIRNEFKGG